MNSLKTILYLFVSKIVPKKFRGFFLTCEDSAVMLSNRDQVSFFDSIRLRMHIFICHCCTNFEKQVDVIDESSAKLKENELSESESKKMDSSKASVLNNIINK